MRANAVYLRKSIPFDVVGVDVREVDSASRKSQNNNGERGYLRVVVRFGAEENGHEKTQAECQKKQTLCLAGDT